MNIIKKPYYLLSIILLFLLSACGSNQHASDTGSISFNLELSRPTTASRAAAATSSDICTDYGITIINVTVATSSGTEVASGNWSCSAHAGTITDVPSGSDYTIRITGTVTGGTIAWRGEKTGVSVTGGETTTAGAVTMAYTGTDATPPSITSSNPSIDASGVPVTNMITAIFSENMAASFINITTFTLKQGATPVSGSVTYDSNTKRAIFIPSTNLSYSTIYTATVTTGVEDMAGNNMQSDYSWNFTTEAPPTSAPSAPTGVSATAGNSQVTITWDAVPGATSYNIYWSKTAGVTKAAGTQISGITSTSYTHTGLTNVTTYYYVVTAVNSFGESSESSEVSATTGTTDTTPPTGSVIINDNDTYSTSSTVNLTIAATDNATLMVISEDSTFLNAAWQPVQSSLDYTFTTGGEKTIYIKLSDVNGLESLPFSDSIYIVGHGSLDPTFGTGGKVMTNLGAGQDNALAVALQADGKIVAAGISYSDANYADINHKYDFALVRYNADGSLDTTFGTEGKVTTNIGGIDAATAVAIQADGKIVAAGSSYSGINNGIAIVRYNTDGTLDTTFDTDGIVTTAVNGGGAASAVSIQADGKIICAGDTSGDFALVRYNTNGTLDSTFGVDGIVTTDLGTFDDQASAVAIQADGKIVAAGSTGSRDFALIRYNANGSLDLTFGIGGKVTTDFGTVYDHAADVVLQADGRIVAAGVTGPYSYYDFALVRYNTDGSLDTTFGSGGKVTTAIGATGNDHAYAVAIQADGKLVAVGYSSGDFAIARYNADGILDGTFGTDGKVKIDFGGFDNAEAVAIQSDGKIVAAGGTNEDYFALIRLGP